jgi:hypothetical protein
LFCGLLTLLASGLASHDASLAKSACATPQRPPLQWRRRRVMRCACDKRSARTLRSVSRRVLTHPAGVLYKAVMRMSLSFSLPSLSPTKMVRQVFEPWK